MERWRLQLQLWWLSLLLWLKCSLLEIHCITSFSLISHNTPSRNSHHSVISWSCPLIRYACSSVWPVGQHAGWHASTHQTAPLSLILFLPLMLLLQSSTYLWTILRYWAQEKADLFSIAFCIICTASLTAKSNYFSLFNMYVSIGMLGELETWWPQWSMDCWKSDPRGKKLQNMNCQGRGTGNRSYR